MMNKTINFVEKHIQPIAGKISQQRHLKALTNAFMLLIPFMTIGSFALILISPVMDYNTLDPGILRSFMHGWANFANVTSPVFGYIYQICMNLLGLYVSLGLAYFLVKSYKMDSFFPVFVTVGTFLIIACMNKENTLDVTYLGTMGMFPAIIITILAFELYRFLSVKGIGKINLDNMGMPEAIADSIANLVPSAIVLFIFSLVSGVLLSTTGLRIPELISALMTPIGGLVNSMPGFILLQFLIQFFWWFGIHDSVITGPMTPFVYQFMAANAASIAAGTSPTDLPYIVTSPFSFMFVTACSNITIALLALFSKSKQIKAIGRLGFVPALFNVTEPLLFGLPMVYNGILLIPFVLTPIVNTVLAYFVMSIGWINHTYLDPSWNMPAIIGQFLSTMDWRTFIFFFVQLGINFAIWVPFFKTFEKQKLAEEEDIENTKS